MKDFLGAIGTHPNTVSFCGHTHTNEHWYFSAADGYAATDQQGGRIATTFWRRYREAGGRVRSMRAGSRWRCSRMAPTHVQRLDPFVVEVYERNRASKKSWVEAGKSSHIWQGGLPADLGAGTHRAVRATDKYGRTHATSMVLEVTA